MSRAIIIGPRYDGNRMVEDPYAPPGSRRWRYRVTHGVVVVVAYGVDMTSWRVEGIGCFEMATVFDGCCPQKAANAAARAMRGFAKVIGGRAA